MFNDFYTIIYKTCIITSIIAFFMYFFTSGNVSIYILTTSYGILIFGILMILLLLLNNVDQSITSYLQIILSILKISGPFLILFFIIGILLYLIINYKNVIIDGHVSNSYNIFNNLSIVLLILQLSIIYTSINNENFKKTGSLSKIITSLLYLLSLLISICLLILFVLLNYYNTDG